MREEAPHSGNGEFIGRIAEAAVRLAALAVLVLWCYQILRPFIAPISWGVILAVATYPGYQRLRRLAGGRRRLAAVLLTLVLLLAVVLPSAMLADSLATGVSGLATQLRDGTLHIPPPPERVAAWPLIGSSLERTWRLASENLEQALREQGPLLRTFGRWLLAQAADVGLGLLQFVIAILIAGALLANAEVGERAGHAIAWRLAGGRGVEFADVATQTVRSVGRGIVGVALIQGLLAGLGLLVAGIPAAGLLTVICVVLGVLQIGVAPVLVPAVIYLFSTADTLTAVGFLVWSILVLPVDNVLKPLLLGRGTSVPVLVVFLGAIGGFIHSGIIGLFVGAVILAVGYRLAQTWLYPPGEASPSGAPEVTPPVR